MLRERSSGQIDGVSQVGSREENPRCRRHIHAFAINTDARVCRGKQRHLPNQWTGSVQSAKDRDEPSRKPLRSVRGHVHGRRAASGEVGDELSGDRPQRQPQMSVAECEERLGKLR